MVIESDPLTTRKHPAAQCEVCPLRGDLGRFVPSDGPEKAKIAFVGEAPGKNEAWEGKPFVGVSGQLLDRVNQHYGIKREEVLLANACSCRAPDGSTPPASAIAACRPRLLAELQERECEDVVALGNSAIKGVLGQEGVFRLRVGPGRTSHYLPDVRIIPTVHPAACLRQADLFPYLVTDIGKLKVSAASPWKLPRYVVSEGRDHALALIEALKEYKVLVVDIETGVEKDTDFDHPNNYDFLCIGVCFDKDRVVVFSETDSNDKVVQEALGELFRRAKLVMHNGKSDCAGLFPAMGDLPLWFDTMLAHYVTDERSGAPIRGLGVLGQELLGYPDWKSWIKRYVTKEEGYRPVPRDLLYKYNAVDCQCTWDLWEHFEPLVYVDDFKGKDGVYIHDFLVRAGDQVKFLELNGLSVDKKYNAELTVSYLDKLEEIEGMIDNIVITSPTWETSYDKKKKGINPRSPQQVKKFLGDNKLIVSTTDADTLTLIKESIEEDSRMTMHLNGEHKASVHKFCSQMLTHRKEQKKYGTYVKGIRKRMFRGRVYPIFLLHGTTSGRPSCRNPNLQNIDRDAIIKRQFVVSKPENVFVQADVGQAELRVMTWLAQDDNLRDIFNDPSIDLFDDQIRPRLIPAHQLAGMTKAELKEVRIRIKAAVYGQAYGRTAYSIALEFGITEREAQKVMDAFFETAPGIPIWQESIRQAVLNGEDLVTPFGRHRRFWLITNDNRKDVMNEALSFKPQSISSDIVLRAFTRLRPALRGKAFLRNIVHDSILAECHRDRADEVSEMLNRYMLDSARELVDGYVDFRTDCKVGTSWDQV